jgi:hypothetical protein
VTSSGKAALVIGSLIGDADRFDNLVLVVLVVLVAFAFLSQSAFRSERLHMFTRFPFHGLDKEVTKPLTLVLGSRYQ